MEAVEGCNIFHIFTISLVFMVQLKKKFKQGYLNEISRRLVKTSKAGVLPFIRIYAIFHIFIISFVFFGPIFKLFDMAVS